MTDVAPGIVFQESSVLPETHPDSPRFKLDLDELPPSDLSPAYTRVTNAASELYGDGPAARDAAAFAWSLVRSERTRLQPATVQVMDHRGHPVVRIAAGTDGVAGELPLLGDPDTLTIGRVATETLHHVAKACLPFGVSLATNQRRDCDPTTECGPRRWADSDQAPALFNLHPGPITVEGIGSYVRHRRLAAHSFDQSGTVGRGVATLLRVVGSDPQMHATPTARRRPASTIPGTAIKREELEDAMREARLTLNEQRTLEEVLTTWLLAPLMARGARADGRPELVVYGRTLVTVTSPHGRDRSGEPKIKWTAVDEGSLIAQVEQTLQDRPGDWVAGFLRALID